MTHPDSTWIAVISTPRARSIPWLTPQELKQEVLYVATSDHKESFYEFCALANLDSGEWMV